MNAFCRLLGELPSEGTRIRIKCLYTPSDNESARIPGRILSGSLTLQFSPNECRQFSDWLQNNGFNHVSPMKILWSSNGSKLQYDLDEETLDVYTDSNQVLRAAYQFSERERLNLTIRPHPNAGAGVQENWRQHRNMIQ